MGDTFKITEKPELGGFVPRSGVAQVFRWSSDNHNIPQGAWEFGGQLRTNRIDYPGADRPTEQVLGPNFTPFTLQGRWKNKFNRAAVGADQPNPAPGKEGNNYAKREMELFEAMCRRGNVVEIEFQKVKIQGLITHWNFSYRRQWDIGYSFTFSPHTRGGGDEIAFTNTQETTSTPKQLADATKKQMQAYLRKIQQRGQMNSADTSALFGAQSADVKGTIVLSKDEARELFGKKPAFGGLPFELLADANEQVSEVSKEVIALSNVVDQRVLALDAETALGISAAITRTDLIIQKAYNMATVAGTLKGSSSLLYRNPIDELNFEVWNKGRGDFARGMVVGTKNTRDELLRREKPDAIALYRPFDGETLYSVSQRFYKNFRSWRLIYERNGLDYTVMTGDELLIIPQAGKR